LATNILLDEAETFFVLNNLTRKSVGIRVWRPPSTLVLPNSALVPAHLPTNMRFSAAGLWPGTLRPDARVVATCILQFAFVI
jgi:hypothetical protein